MSLSQILQQTGVWRGRDHAFHQTQAQQKEPGIASGYTTLDEQLPFAGWPQGALTEILHDSAGQGELQLLMPALSHLSHDQRYIAMIDPPWTPYAPALSAAGIHLPYFISIGPLSDEDRLWTLEQTLRVGHCGAVLGWPRKDLDTKTLRRLQLAAEAGNSCGFLFRQPHFRKQHSPAALRLQLHTNTSGQQLEVIKCRGRYFSSPFISLTPQTSALPLA